MYIYIASPLCCNSEKEYNINLNNYVKSFGHKTYLPQLDGGLLSDLVRSGLNETEVRDKLFSLDLQMMNKCEAILLNLDGRAIDEGACFELGYMYSLGKSCIGIKTDSRSFIRGKNNLMIDGALSHLFYDWKTLGDFLINYSI